MVSYTKKGNNAELNNILKDILCCIILNDIYKAGFSVSRLKYIKKIYIDKTLIFCKYFITETIISEF